MMHRSPILATGLGVSERGCDTASNYVLYVCTCTGTGIFELALRYIHISSCDKRTKRAKEAILIVFLV